MKHLLEAKRYYPRLVIAWLAASTALAAQPVNDNFADRIVLSGARVTTTGTNVGATREEREPDLVRGNSPTRTSTVWWSWTAPSEGLLVVSVIGSDFTAAVDILTGAALNELHLVSSCQSALPWCDTGRAQVSAGTACQIVVAGNSGDTAGNILLNLAFFERPPNDNFTNRIHLGSGNVSTIGANTAATLEPREHWPWFDEFYSKSLWWSWTAPASGPATMGVEASPFHPDALLFGEYPGARTSLSIFVGDSLDTAMLLTNQFSPDLRSAPALSQVTFDAVAGTTYQIAANGSLSLFRSLTLSIAQTAPPLAVVTSPLEGADFFAGEPITFSAEASDQDGAVSAIDFYFEEYFGRNDWAFRDMARPFSRIWTNLPPGDYNLFARATDNLGATADSIPIRFNVRPVNDLFARRIAFTGTSVTVTGSLGNASTEWGEPSETGSASVWWSWTAPASGTFTITTATPEGDSTAFAVFAGASLTNLTLIASSLYLGFGTSYTARAVISAEAGKAYPIAVSGGGYANWCALSVAQTSPPTVTMTSPTQGGEFVVGEPVTFSATVSEDGVVRRVDFVLDGYQVLGSLTNRPFTLVHTFDRGYSWHQVRAWAVDDTGLATPSDPISFEVHYPGPDNDHFGNRSPLTGSYVSVYAPTANATFETGEPRVLKNGSVWWMWTAPESRPFTITVQSQNGYWPSLAVFTGANLTNLTLITNSAFAGSDATYETRVILDAQVGVAYALAVGSGGWITLSVADTLPPVVSVTNPTNNSVFIAGETINLSASASAPDGTIQLVDFYLNGYTRLGFVTSSPFVLPVTTTNLNGYYWIQAWATDNRGFRTASDIVSIQVKPRPPTNDAFADRIPFTGSFVTVTGSTANATFEVGEVISLYNGSAWWAWTAPESATYTINVTSEYEWSPPLAVFAGSTLAELNRITDNTQEYEIPHFTARVVFQAEAGTTYPIAVGARGDVAISVLRTVPPSVTITSPTNETPFTIGQTISMTAEVADPDNVSSVAFYFNNSLLVGTVTNRPFSLDFRVTEGVYSFSAWVTDKYGLTTIAYGSFSGIRSQAPPLNDDFANRTRLSGTLVVADGNLYNATSEPDEPGPEPFFEFGSVWWSWIAPASGTVTLTSLDGIPKVYTGSGVTNLAAVDLAAVDTNASFSRVSQLSFKAIAGTEYEITVRVGLPDSYASGTRLALFLDARELRAPRMLREGLFAFDLRTTVERLWIIEASTNLANWTPVAAGRCADGTLEFLDPTAASFPRRFYRAVSEP